LISDEYPDLVHINNRIIQSKSYYEKCGNIDIETISLREEEMYYM